MIHGMFPSALQGGGGPHARCIQHTFEAYGIVASGEFVLSDGFLAHASFQESMDKFFDEVTKQSVDDLHTTVVDARLRKQGGEVPSDVWREDLHYCAATRAWAMLLLKMGRERLPAELQEVFPSTFLIHGSSRPVSARGCKPKAAGRDCIRCLSIQREREQGGGSVECAGRGRNAPPVSPPFLTWHAGSAGVGTPPGGWYEPMGQEDNLTTIHGWQIDNF